MQLEKFALRAYKLFEKNTIHFLSLQGNEQVKSDPITTEKIPCISPKIFEALGSMRDQLKRIINLI